MDLRVIETPALALQREAEGLGLVQPEEAVAPAGKPLKQSDPGQGMKGIKEESVRMDGKTLFSP